MALDPIVQAIVDHLPPFAPAGSIPAATLRANVHAAMTASSPWNVPLGRIDDLTIPGPGGPLRARVYVPQGKLPFPIVVYFHGGGFVVGDLDTHDNIARALAHASDCIVLSIDYRLAPEHPYPAATDDAWAATCWVAQHGAELGGDPSRLAVAGDSAGGVLSSAVALRARDAGGPTLRAQVNIYGSCNYPSERTASAKEFDKAPLLSQADVEYFWKQYLPNPDRDQNEPSASPFRAQSHANLAPAFIATAEADPTRDDSEAYAAKLRAAGVPTELVRYPGMIHGFVAFLGIIPAAQKAIDDAAQWLKRHLV